MPSRQSLQEKSCLGNNMIMQCKECQGELEVARSCWKVRMRCKKCHKEFQIHEVADILDEKTEELLSRYPSIIYD